MLWCHEQAVGYSSTGDELGILKELLTGPRKLGVRYQTKLEDLNARDCAALLETFRFFCSHNDYDETLILALYDNALKLLEKNKEHVNKT